MSDQEHPRDAASPNASHVAFSSSSSTIPVKIPEVRTLPYSRLSSRAHSASSISPSPGQRILSSVSPSSDHYLLSAQQQQQQQQPQQGLPFQQLYPAQQAPLNPRSRSAEGLGSIPALPQPNKRPPLPPSPVANRAQGSTGSLNPLAAAWLNPGEGSSSSSNSRQPRLLSAAVCASSSEPNPSLLSGSSSTGAWGLRQYSQHNQEQTVQYNAQYNEQYNQYNAQQQQQQQFGQYACSVGSASASPAEGLLSAAIASEELSAAAGNPYHPQHSAAMQALLDHQTLQLQQLQQQREQQNSSGGRGMFARTNSFSSNMAASPGAASPRMSPRVSPRAFSRRGSYNRLSELGTSPGLIEASFMGMAARSSQPANSSSSRSAALQQLMHQQQQQQAAIRQQQEEQLRSLRHSQSTLSLENWNGPGGLDSVAGSRAPSAGGVDANLPNVTQQAALDWDIVQQQLQQQQRGGSAGAAAAGSTPRLGHLPTSQPARGLRALPGRPGLHWLSQADDSESATRGLLGLPRPGLRQQRPGGFVAQQQQQQVLKLSQPPQQQQGLQQQGLDSSQDIQGLDGGLTLHPPSGAIQQATPQRIQFDPSIAAAYESANGVKADPQRTISSSNSPLATAAPRVLFSSSSSRSFGRQNSISGKDRDRTSAGGLEGLSKTLSRSSSYVGMPTCLICLDQLTTADFESGEAMYLACRCKGEVALRHRQCAEKWSRIKGNVICDVCKGPILNLPDVPPLPAPPQPAAADDRLLFQGVGLWGPLGDEPADVADYVFDCIRVTWVVLIVCILFFELSAARAFSIGILAGVSYVALSVSLAAWKRCRQRRQEEEEGVGWQEGLHAAFLPVRGRSHYLPM